MTEIEKARGMNDRQRLKLLEDMAGLVAGMRPVSTGMIAGREARRRSARATSSIRANAPGGGSGGAPGGGGHSDPTLGAVESPADRAAKVELELAQWDEQLIEAADLLANLAAKIARAQRTPKEERPPEQKPLVGCRSCARLGGWFNEVAVGQYADLCRRCGDFKGTERRVPPLGLIELLRQGKPWTASAIERAMKAEANHSDRALLKAGG